MWLFAPNGFVSIVEDKENPECLLVRGRVKGDIEALFPGAEVTMTPQRDYRFRASLPRGLVASVVAGHVESINYDNFKNSTAPDRHNPYLEIWGTMYRLQETRRPRRRFRKGRKAPRRSQESVTYNDSLNWLDYYDRQDASIR